MTMEIVSGKRSHDLDAVGLHARLPGMTGVQIDLGTGDGRLVRALARAHPDWLIIGLDACREPLRPIARTAPPNALFVIAHLPGRPTELVGLADRVTIVCPWGSLLQGLVGDDDALRQSVRDLCRPGARLQVVVNAGALQQVGWSLAVGGDLLTRRLADAGFVSASREVLTAAGLRIWPTSWARRLAAGGQEQALAITATAAAVEATADGWRMASGDRPGAGPVRSPARSVPPPPAWVAAARSG